MLTALDTNVVLRGILRDDPDQGAIADSIFANPKSRILIVVTVIAELEWVLRSVYKWPRSAINDTLHTLLDHENVSTPDEHLIRWALTRHNAGGDLADMLHVAQSQMASRFLTFDADLVRRAGKDAQPPVELLGQ